MRFSNPEANALVRKPKFYGKLAVTFLVLCLIKWLAPNTIPFGLFDFIRFQWSWEKFATIPWQFFLIIPIVGVVGLIVTKNTYWENRRLVETYKDRMVTSLLAGIFEEVSFRWLAFYYAIFLFSVDQMLIDWLGKAGYIQMIHQANWIVGTLAVIGINVIGVIAYAILDTKEANCLLRTLALIVVVAVVALDMFLILIFMRWFYTAVAFPVVGWLTLGKFAAIFAMAWPVGAAMISVNGNFSSGHAYNGPLGLIHSWAFGMLMFWITINFGLLAAILVHAVWDMALMTFLTTDAISELLTNTSR